MPLQDEEALVRRAAAGDSTAFATLYDRYERSAYNLCYRITGSREDAADATQETFLKVLERLPRLEGRELNFGAYVMTAARNASYDATERRKRSAPAGDIPDSAVPLGAGDDSDVPERAALREAHQEQIRVANERLPARQREVLALRELQDLSYGEVAQIMGMNQNSVAQLISRARINLRDGLRQTALGSVASASPQCDRAMPLLAMHQDGVLEDPWLTEHLAGCGPCRVRLEAMEEAAVAYRQWLLLTPLAWLRDEIAHAAERTSAKPHGRRLLAGAGATFALLLALAFLAADGAESPTRAFAPAATPTPEAKRVVHATAAPKPVVKKRRPAKRGKVVAAKPTAPRKKPPADAPLTIAAAPSESAPVETRERSKPPTPRVKSRRDPVPVPEPVVLADPPPAEQPVIPDEPPPPDPPCTGPNCPGTTPPCPGTSAANCPPPPKPPVLTCRSCGLVAPVPPPPRRLELSVKP